MYIRLISRIHHRSLPISNIEGRKLGMIVCNQYHHVTRNQRRYIRKIMAVYASLFRFSLSLLISSLSGSLAEGNGTNCGSCSVMSVSTKSHPLRHTEKWNAPSMPESILENTCRHSSWVPSEWQEKSSSLVCDRVVKYQIETRPLSKRSL